MLAYAGAETSTIGTFYKEDRLVARGYNFCSFFYLWSPTRLPFFQGRSVSLIHCNSLLHLPLRSLNLSMMLIAWDR